MIKMTDEAIVNHTNDVMNQNTFSSGTGTYNIFATDIALFYDKGVRSIAFEGTCYDFFGQESYLESTYYLVTQSSGVKMAYDIDFLVYDTNFGEYAFFDFVFADCSSGNTTELSVNIALQKIDSTGAWIDAVDPTEAIDGEYVPPGLAIDTIYRLKIEVTTPGSIVATEFFVRLEMVIYEPWVILDDFSAFLPVDVDIEYEFTEDLFVNVANVSEASLQFGCTSCDGEECMGQSGVLDFNALYNDSNKTIIVPAGTFAIDSCYEVEVSVVYKGMVGTNFGFIGTTGASETSYSCELDIQDGQYLNPRHSGIALNVISHLTKIFQEKIPQ